MSDNELMEDREVMQGVQLNKTVSFDVLIRAASSVIPIMTGVWLVAGLVSDIKLETAANRSQISVLQLSLTQLQLSVSHLNEVVIATNNLAQISNTRIDNMADAIRDNRQTLDKQNDRMNGFQTELSRVARVNDDKGNQAR